MIQLESYIDSTYLKTPEQSGVSEKDTEQRVIDLVEEAIAHSFYEVMIRPDYVRLCKELIEKKGAKVKAGTVIGFHEGTASVEEKVKEAKKAIEDGADELDFVINFEKYKLGKIEEVQNEFVTCTKLGIDHHKVVKWIIEIAALTDQQIADLTSKIRDWAEQNFKGQEENIFVKSSTGFYKTEDGSPNGATLEGIKIMVANAGKLPVKAAGGMRTYQDAVDMIHAGVKRIGTSSALALIQGGNQPVDGY